MGAKNEAIYSYTAVHTQGHLFLSLPFIFDNKLSDNVTRELDDRVSFSSFGTFPLQSSVFFLYLLFKRRFSPSKYTQIEAQYTSNTQGGAGGYKRTTCLNSLSNVCSKDIKKIIQKVVVGIL